MISLAIWLAVLWVCVGAGAGIALRLRAGGSRLAEELPLAAALGMGVLSYGVLALGLLGALSLWSTLALLLVLAATSWRQMLRIARALPGAIRSLGPFRLRLLPISLVLLVAFCATLLAALAPARELDYDSLVYHLAVPEIWLQDGRIHPIPWLTHSNFPFTMEMLYLFGLLLRGQIVAKLFHFGCGWLLVCAVFAFARRWWGARAGWLGAAIFAAIPLVGWEMTTAYNELALALYAFLAVCALWRYLDGRARGEGAGWLWVAAILCGLGMGVKMLAGAVFLFALAALVWGLRNAPHRGRAARQTALFALIAAAVAAPWYLKSYLWTGNPVYPFFYEVFGGRWWTAARAREYAEAQAAFGLGTSVMAFLALPWNLTVRPRWFFDQPDVLRAFNVYVTVYGPLLLALPPTLLLSGRLRGGGRLLLWFALAYAAIWFLLTQNGRYLIPILPGLAACAGLAAARLLGRGGVTAGAAAVALLLGLPAGLFPEMVLAADAARVAVGLESEDTYLSRTSPIYRTLEAVNRATPNGSKIIVLGHEPRMFYLERDYMLGNHAEIFDEGELASPEAFLAALREREVTHVLLDAAVAEDVRLRRGTIERLLGALAARGALSHVADCGPMTVWEIAYERAEARR